MARNPERRLTCLKYSLFTYNVIGLMLSIVIFGLAVWIFADWDMKYFLGTLQNYQFNQGAAILLSGAIVSFFTLLLGCWAAVTEHRTSLLIYGILMLCAAVVELGGTAYILDQSTLWSSGTWWLYDRFYQLIYQSAWNPQAAELLRVVQEHIGCCGSWNSGDYDNVHLPVPNECRSPSTGNEWTYGCFEVFPRYLETKSGPIAGMTLGLIIVQILASTSAFWMRSIIGKMKRNSAMYKQVPRAGR